MKSLIDHFHGRINRRNFFIGGLLCFLFFLGLEGFITYADLYHLNENLLIGIVGVWSVLLFTFSFSLNIRRLHDFGQSGWWCVLYLVPLVNIAIPFVLLFKAGSEKENKYGKTPKPQTSINELFN
jgi:uncharacterized membrane protein YhaH (DUF805 family)